MACAGLRHESFGHDSCIVGPQASEISGPNWRWEELPAHSSAFLGKMAAICKRWKDLQNKSQVHGKWTNCSPSCPPVWTHLDPLFHLEVGTSQTQKRIHPDFVMRVEFQIVQGIRFWVALIHVFMMVRAAYIRILQAWKEQVSKTQYEKHRTRQKVETWEKIHLWLHEQHHVEQKFVSSVSRVHYYCKIIIIIIINAFTSIFILI